MARGRDAQARKKERSRQASKDDAKGAIGQTAWSVRAGSGGQKLAHSTKNCATN